MVELSDLPFAVEGAVIAVLDDGSIEVMGDDGDLTCYKPDRQAQCWVCGAMPFKLKRITK